MDHRHGRRYVAAGIERLELTSPSGQPHEEGILMKLDARRTAVLALHWLNDIVTPQGAFGPFFAAMVEESGALDRTSRLLETARAHNVLVIYTRVCFRPGYADLLANNPLLGMVAEKGALVDGENGAKIVDAITPQGDDLVIDHRRLTAFYGTELETLLRKRGIDTLLLTGVATNVTVEGTAREAVNQGYRTIVLADCCAAATSAAHEASLESLRLLAEVGSSSDAGAALTASSPDPTASWPAENL